MLNKSAPMKASILLLSIVFLAGLAQAQTYAVKGERVYTVSGRMIPNGVVLVKDGKIERVGTAAQVRIPVGYAVTEAVVVTPGFIDARNTVGISGYLNVPADQDQLERSSPFQPELRAIDAYNARERLVEYVRELGITTIPCEVFVEIGLALRQRSPFKTHFTVELANGHYGYLPTPEQHRLGGYETWLGTCRLDEHASVQISDELVGMLKQLNAR